MKSNFLTLVVGLWVLMGKLRRSHHAKFSQISFNFSNSLRKDAFYEQYFFFFGRNEILLFLFSAGPPSVAPCSNAFFLLLNPPLQISRKSSPTTWTRKFESRWCTYHGWRFLALNLPGFFRSLTRGSLVSNPAAKQFLSSAFISPKTWCRTKKNKYASSA